jgi:hypothetical protein
MGALLDIGKKPRRCYSHLYGNLGVAPDIVERKTRLSSCYNGRNLGAVYYNRWKTWAMFLKLGRKPRALFLIMGRKSRICFDFREGN